MIFRLEPAMPAHMYKTYSMTRPVKSHWVQATCEDVDCAAYLNGWVTVIDEATELGQGQAAYIRADRSRKHAETRTPASLTEFTFPLGQPCFRASEHRKPVERPAIFMVRGGDYRGNPMQVRTRVCRDAGEWVEDFAEHQDMLATAINRG